MLSVLLRACYLDDIDHSPLEMTHESGSAGETLGIGVVYGLPTAFPVV